MTRTQGPLRRVVFATLQRARTWCGNMRARVNFLPTVSQKWWTVGSTRRRQNEPTSSLSRNRRNTRMVDTLPATTNTARSADALFAVVYDRLKRLANRQLGRGPRHTLDTTALVHEVYLRLENGRDTAFARPGQFFAYAARAMRHILIDRARTRMRQKAGGDWVKVALTDDDGMQGAIESAEQALALEQALTQLEQVDERAARVVDSAISPAWLPEQVAQVLQGPRHTVDRDWRYACAFLQAKLG